MVPVGSESSGYNNATTMKTRRKGDRKLKVNLRCYTLCKRFNHEKDFNSWISKESAKVPWYLCSTYKAGEVFKRIYACSFRKRLGYKKCERQLMVLFYPNGTVEVMDSNNGSEHTHCPLDTVDETSEFRTVIVLRSQAEFSSWMAKQRDKFAWHRRAGRRSFANVDYYQCASIGQNGEMCRRLMYVEYTAEDGVIVKELQGLPPHDSTTVHRKSFSGPTKLKRQKHEDDDPMIALPSTSALKPTADCLGALSTIPPRVTVGQENENEKNLENKEFEENTVKEAGELPSIEDFVIIPDEEYELNDNGGCTRWNKREPGDEAADNFRAASAKCITPPSDPALVFIGDNNSEGTSNSKWQCSVSDNTTLRKDVNIQCPASTDKGSKYNLDHFAEELAEKLSKTPLERMAEIRESLRREMDEVFARQIVREIISRSYSTDACREVLDRIRDVLRPP